jgi:hypothetical protein
LSDTGAGVAVVPGAAGRASATGATEGERLIGVVSSATDWDETVLAVVSGGSVAGSDDAGDRAAAGGAFVGGALAGRGFACGALTDGAGGGGDAMVSGGVGSRVDGLDRTRAATVALRGIECERVGGTLVRAALAVTPFAVIGGS